MLKFTILFVSSAKQRTRRDEMKRQVISRGLGMAMGLKMEREVRTQECLGDVEWIEMRNEMSIFIVNIKVVEWRE